MPQHTRRRCIAPKHTHLLQEAVVETDDVMALAQGGQQLRLLDAVLLLRGAHVAQVDRLERVAQAVRAPHCAMHAPEAA